MKFLNSLFAVLSLAFLPGNAQAIDGGFIYDGRLTKLDGTPIQDSSVSFRLAIVSPSPTACVLYQEDFTLNMTGSNGYFVIDVGTGTRSGTTTGNTLVGVFKNSTSITGESCGSGGPLYTPAVGDIRHLRVTVVPSSTNVAETLTLMPIQGVPSATTVGGYAASDLAKLGAGQLTQANLESIFTATNFSELNNLLGGNSTKYAPTTVANGQTLPSYSGSPASPNLGSIWYDTSTGYLKMKAASGIITLSGSSSGGSGGLSPSLASGQIFIGSSGGVATGVTPTGDLNLSNSGYFNIAKIQNKTVAATSPVAGSFFRYSGTQWEPQTVSFSEINYGSGANANLIFAGPSSGGSGAPTFRALTTADLPAGVVSPWSTNSAQIYYTSGRVGVGTMFPKAPLDVAGFTGSDSAIIIPRATTANRPFSPVDGMLRYNTDLSAFEGYANYNWVGLGSPWMTNGSNISYMTGNIGIGTTMPTLPLDVQSTSSSGTSIRAMNVSNSSPGSSVVLGRSRGFSGSPTTLQAGDTLGTVQFTGYNGSSTSPGAIIQATAKENFSSTAYGTNLTFSTVANGTATMNTRMIITADGKVGIGTLAPVYPLEVVGDINASGSVRSAGVVLTSDIRFKKNIETIEGALAKILNLRGVRYDWRREEFPQRHFNSRKQMGVIAQEVEAQFPEAVDTAADGYKAVNYPALVSPLIEATRELNAKIETLESENASLKAKLDQQARDLEAIKARLGL